MKNLKDFINEGKTTEHNEWSIDYGNDGKYGYMWCDSNSGLIGVVSFDKLEEFAKKQGFDVDDYMDIDKLKVGQSAYDGVSMIYTRIW